MKSLVLIFTLFTISFNSMASLESNYRKGKRDVKTRKEIAKDPNFGKGVGVVFVVVVLTTVAIGVSSKRKSRKNLEQKEGEYENAIKLLSENLQVDTESLKNFFERDINFTSEVTINENFNSNIFSDLLIISLYLKKNYGQKYTKSYDNINSFKNNLLFSFKQSLLIQKYGNEKGIKLSNQEFYIGMTKEELEDSKGSPDKIEMEKLKTKTKEIWIYGNKSSGDVFVFVNDLLERFTDR